MAKQNENIGINIGMEKTETEKYSPTNFWHGQYAILGSIVFFQLVNIVVYKIGKPKSVREDSWRWTNLVVSWVHAMVIGVWDLACFILYPELISDLLYHRNNFTYFMVATSTGYFIYDFIDMIINNKIFKLWEVTLHHIAVTSMFAMNVYEQSYLAFNCVALLAEVNSFFLHSRKLLQMMQYQYESKFYKLVCCLNLVTFFVFRGISVISIDISLYYWREKVTKVYYYSLFTSMIFMNAMSPILFWRLLKNDFLRKPRKENGVNNGEKIKVNGNNNVPHLNDLHLKSQ